MPARKRPAPNSTTYRRLRALSKQPEPAVAADALTQRVRAALAGVPDVREKKMFGSTGFLVRGKLCITARATRLMLRIDPADHDAAIKRIGCTTVIMKGRPYRGYVFVNAGAVKTARSLSSWLKQALDHNRQFVGEGRIRARPKH
jgi:TfoX/Sxy family transcriptional regulator of competence genes